MPPHQAVIDVDCRDDMFDNHQPISPLFRDDNDNSGHGRGSGGPVVPPVTPSTPCRLLRRQANPEFAAVIAVCPSRERTISTEDYYSSTSPSAPSQQRKQPASRQSRITEIIGPESAYVKVSSSHVVGISPLTHPSVLPPTHNSGVTNSTTDETKTIVPPHKPDTPSSSSEEEEKEKMVVSPSNEVGNLRSVEQKQPSSSSSLFRRFMPKLKKRVKGVSLPQRSLVK
jgi:hypothetical protein